MKFSHQNTHPVPFSSKSVHDTVAELATLTESTFPNEEEKEKNKKAASYWYLPVNTTVQ